jgi:hypothetical protein
MHIPSIIRTSDEDAVAYFLSVSITPLSLHSCFYISRRPMGPMILKNILFGGRASIDNGNAVSPIPSKYVCSANLRSFEHEQEAVSQQAP